MDNGRPIEVIERPAQSNTLGAVAATLGGAAILGVGWNAVSNTLSRYLGNIGANIGALNGTLPGIAPVIAPQVMTVPALESFSDKYVTKEVAMLLAENGQLKAQIYTDAKAEVLNNKICELEKSQAVNAVRDHDFRHYVEREFIHQPKAHMKHRLLETTEEHCCCGHHHRNHSHHSHSSQTSQ